MIDLKIINIYYYNNTGSSNEYNFPVLCLGCRDREMKKHLIQICDKKLAPNFRVVKSEFEKILESYGGDLSSINVIDSKEAPNSLFGEECVELITRYPWQVRNIRNDGIFSQTFQADVKWAKMALSKIIKELDLDGPYLRVPNNYMYKMLKVKDMEKIPKNEFFLVKYRICYYDIETDSRKIPYNMTYQEMKEMPIVSITFYDNYEDVYYEFVWHPKFIETVKREYENYEILDNVSDDEIIINNIVRWECTTEQEMLSKFFNCFSSKKFDILFSYFGEGGYKKVGGGRRWINGFDTPAIYARSSNFSMLEDMQKMSPCPKVKKKSGNWEGVYLRTGKNDKRQVVIKGLDQIDFVFSADVLKLADKHIDFRGGKLSEWMEYFLDYNKLDKNDMRVWQYWLQEDL